MKTREKLNTMECQWHKDILDQRKKKIESGEAKFITLDRLRAALESIAIRLSHKNSVWIKACFWACNH
jgi:hypothetical protein